MFKSESAGGILGAVGGSGLFRSFFKVLSSSVKLFIVRCQIFSVLIAVHLMVGDVSLPVEFPGDTINFLRVPFKGTSNVMNGAQLVVHALCT